MAMTIFAVDINDTTSGMCFGPFDSYYEANVVLGTYGLKTKDVLFYTSYGYASKGVTTATKTVPKMEEVTIDFKKNKLTLKGADEAVVKYGDYTLKANTTYNLSGWNYSWDALQTAIKNQATSLVIKGKPQLEGEYLNEMLHL